MSTGCSRARSGGLVPPLAPVLQQPSAVLIAWVTTVARAGAAVGIDLDRPTALLVLAAGCAAGALAVVSRSRRARRRRDR